MEDGAQSIRKTSAKLCLQIWNKGNRERTKGAAR